MLAHSLLRTPSRCVFPLFLKLVLRQEEAIQFKGGVLKQAWKGRNAPSECSSYRALLVSSNIGKVLHGALRACCVPSLARAVSPLQLGGLPRVPVLFPAHVVRAFQSWCRAGSYAVLYLDLREAFYKVCRPMLDGRWAQFCNTLGSAWTANEMSYVRL